MAHDTIFAKLQHIILGKLGAYVTLGRYGGVKRDVLMLSLFGRKREQHARNRAEAKALVDEHGDRAENFVRDRIGATTWKIRDHAHWQRIAKHVKVLLR